MHLLLPLSLGQLFGLPREYTQVVCTCIGGLFIQQLQCYGASTVCGGAFKLQLLNERRTDRMCIRSPKDHYILWTPYNISFCSNSKRREPCNIIVLSFGTETKKVNHMDSKEEYIVNSFTCEWVKKNPCKRCFVFDWFILQSSRSDTY